MSVKEVINKIIDEFNENKNSHVFLIETNDTTKALKDVKKVIKTILNPTNDNINTQIDDENYIELCIVRPENDEIKTDSIAYLQDRLKIKPILSPNMFYIICDADKMNDKSSNKLLKTIEEPNEGNVGFLISQNIDLILPTIKSRCELAILMYDKKSESIALEDNETLYKLISLLETGSLFDFHKFKKTIDMSLNGKSLLNEALNCYNAVAFENENCNEKIKMTIKKNNSYPRIIKKAKYLNETLNKLTKPMNTDLLYDKVFIELRRM